MPTRPPAQLGGGLSAAPAARRASPPRRAGSGSPRSPGMRQARGREALGNEIGPARRRSRRRAAGPRARWDPAERRPNADPVTTTRSGSPADVQAHRRRSRRASPAAATRRRAPRSGSGARAWRRTRRRRASRCRARRSGPGRSPARRGMSSFTSCSSARRTSSISPCVVGTAGTHAVSATSRVSAPARAAAPGASTSGAVGSPTIR